MKEIQDVERKVYHSLKMKWKMYARRSKRDSIEQAVMMGFLNFFERPFKRLPVDSNLPKQTEVSKVESQVSEIKSQIDDASLPLNLENYRIFLSRPFNETDEAVTADNAAKTDQPTNEQVLRAHSDSKLKRFFEGYAFLILSRFTFVFALVFIFRLPQLIKPSGSTLVDDTMKTLELEKAQEESRSQQPVSTPNRLV